MSNLLSAGYTPKAHLCFSSWLLKITALVGLTRRLYDDKHLDHLLSHLSEMGRQVRHVFAAKNSRSSPRPSQAKAGIAGGLGLTDPD